MQCCEALSQEMCTLECVISLAFKYLHTGSLKQRSMCLLVSHQPGTNVVLTVQNSNVVSKLQKYLPYAVPYIYNNIGHFVGQAIIISDTWSNRPGRYPNRAELLCRNVGVTEPRIWPSMPHFLAGEGLMRSHV